jgi:uncharacterized membrane protein
MKKLFLIPVFGFIALFVLQAYTMNSYETKEVALTFDEAIPPHVKSVVDQKCYGCHNAESKNEKGKKKLDWDEFESFRKAKQLATMAKINEVLVEGDMPPAKFLENKPEGALTPEELQTLMDWSAGKKKAPK